MDRERIGAFLDRFVGYASGATTMGLLAIADRSGLLSWMAHNGPGTVEEIAAGAGLEPRYVTEILSGLTAASTVEYEPAGGLFTLPPEHALFLVDESSPYCMGGWIDMIPVMVEHVDDLVDATINGGGVSFDEFGEAMVAGIDRGNRPSQEVFLIDRWLPAIPGLTDLLAEGIRVADVGCGAGTVAILMAKAFPDSQVIGFDVSADSLEMARNRAGSLTNVEFENRAADELPSQPSFDLITAFDVIHDLPDPLASLSRIRAALVDDGRFLMMEPKASSHLEENIGDRFALLYGVSAMFCMTQSLAAGGEGLGASWGREMAEQYARKAGFSSFERLEEIENKFSSFFLLRP